MNKAYQYPRIPDDDYAKALGQYRLQVGGVLGAFDLYGMGDYIPGALQTIVSLTEQFGMRIRGKDQIIQVDFPTYNADD